MLTKLEDVLKSNKLDKVLADEEQGLLQLTKVIKAGTLYFKVQDDFHEEMEFIFLQRMKVDFPYLISLKGQCT